MECKACATKRKGALSNTEVDSDLARRLHAHEVVCKVAIQLGHSTHYGGQGGPGIKTRDKIGLLRLGTEEFGLTLQQARYCIMRARNWLEEIRQAERLRNAAEMKRSQMPFRKAA